MLRPRAAARPTHVDLTLSLLVTFLQCLFFIYMSILALIVSERRRRKAAEAELIHLRAQLAHLTSTLDGQASAPNSNCVLEHRPQPEPPADHQQDLARQVIDANPHLVYVENEAGECILSNKRYAQLLSQRALTGEGKTTDAERAQMSRPRVVDAPTTFEESYRLLNGQTYWYYTTQIPLVRSDGSRYLLTYSSDITELKRAYQLGEESGRAKQMFLANMSHEFRTPLHGVMGLAELLKKEVLSAEQLDYVEMIQYSTENLLLVIDDVLNFTKAETGKINIESIPFDLVKTVQQAASSLTFKTAEKGLHLRVEEPAELLPLLQGDPYRLHQVLVNLLGNAVKFTPQGSITLTIEPGERIGDTVPVTLSVLDTGIGIRADHLDHIFSSFGQADNSISRLYGGSGLGLAICKNLIELQGGQIGVHSTPGQGSCFYFTIPYAVSDQQLVIKPVVALSSELIRGLRVLLVEDDAINQLLAVTMLGQWEVEVDLAQNGEVAVARALQQGYDVILMDIQMPEMDGIEATAQLRREGGANLHTPIVAVTADAIRIDANTCQALGFTDFLLKPYTQAALHQLLTRVSQRETHPAVGVPSFFAPADSMALPETELHYDFLGLGKLGTDAEFTGRLLKIFLDRVPSQVQVLRDAIAREDWALASSEAHKLKTTFGTLNIHPAADYLGQLEERAERQAPVSEMVPFLDAVSIATQQYAVLFQRDLGLLL